MESERHRAGRRFVVFPSTFSGFGSGEECQREDGLSPPLFRVQESRKTPFLILGPLLICTSFSSNMTRDLVCFCDRLLRKSETPAHPTLQYIKLEDVYRQFTLEHTLVIMVHDFVNDVSFICLFVSYING